MITGTFIFLMIVVIAVCIMLIMVILSQNPKGGGLSSTFGGGGGSQMFGVQRTNNFLDRATWTLSILIAVVIILASVMLPRRNQSNLPDIPTQEQTVPQTKDTGVTDNTTPSENTETPVSK